MSSSALIIRKIVPAAISRRQKADKHARDLNIVGNRLEFTHLCNSKAVITSNATDTTDSISVTA